MSLRYDQLPAKLRAQVDAQIGKQPRQRRSRTEVSGGTTTEWRCAADGATFDDLDAMEAHVDAPDHPTGRYECIDPANRVTSSP